MDEATRVVRFDHHGRAVGDPFPFSIRPGNPFGLLGPWSPVVSPDGRRIAFGYDISHTSCQPACSTEGAFGTAYAHADRFTELQALGNFRGWTEPSWVDDAGDATAPVPPGPIPPAPGSGTPALTTQPPPAAASLALTGRPSLATALRRGMSVRVVTARPGPVSVIAALPAATTQRLHVARVVAHGTAPAKRARRRCACASPPRRDGGCAGPARSA